MLASPGGEQYPVVGLNLLFFSTQRHGKKSLRLSVTLSASIDGSDRVDAQFLPKCMYVSPPFVRRRTKKAYLARFLEMHASPPVSVLQGQVLKLLVR